MAKMSQREIETFLADPMVAHLVTVRPDGHAHVVPVWFEWKGRRAQVMTDRSSVKARNLGDTQMVALSIAKEQRPYQYVTVEGMARITTDNLAEVVRRICFCYDGPERGPAFAQELLADDHLVLIEISPTRVVSWKDDD